MAEPNPNTPVNEPAPAPEKTFTQAEVDTLIGKRLAKAMKGMPDEAELTAFRSWKESQQTEKDRWDNLTKERDSAKNQLTAAQTELEQLKREKILIGNGVPAEDVDYYSFKLGKLVTDEKTFEKVADEFFKENSPGKVRVDMTGRLSGSGADRTANEQMNALIRGALK